MYTKEISLKFKNVSSNNVSILKIITLEFLNVYSILFYEKKQHFQLNEIAVRKNSTKKLQ